MTDTVVFVAVPYQTRFGLLYHPGRYYPGTGESRVVALTLWGHPSNAIAQSRQMWDDAIEIAESFKEEPTWPGPQLSSQA